MVDGEVAAGES
jgi:ADP-ribose pyrophosphatase YjhB (NUDIX family)